MSALFMASNISVGASGALFGLLGSMLSELITNWTIYENKVDTYIRASVFRNYSILHVSNSFLV
jgi:membrane associated rhomboid family serine protease